MNETPLYPVPQRVYFLMSPVQRSELRKHHQRAASTLSKISDISIKFEESKASEFLAAKIEELENETSYIVTIKAGLEEASAKGVLAVTDYKKELAPYLIRIRSVRSILRVLKQQRHVVEEDLTERVQAEEHRLLERAYQDMIVTRLMKAKGKQQGKRLSQSAFEKEINRYYSAVCSNNDEMVWCHVLGMFIDERCAKAAHLVPESLDPEELGHLFGDEDAVISIPQNGLSLHHKVESLLDRGDIAIVPMLGAMNQLTREWRCIVLNESLKTKIVLQENTAPGQTPLIIRVKDLDDRPLQFLSSNRPSRRYLYMRFVISYLWCKRNSVHGLDQNVQLKRFWPSEGTYLERSTLQTLASCIAGCEIPKDLTDEHTFDHPSNPERNVPIGMAMAADLLYAHEAS